MEEFRAIDGFNNYQISNLGNVKNLTTHKLLKNNCSDRYYKVDLRQNKVAVTHTIHRLVAEAFIANPNNKPCVDHIDGNTLNNNKNNLRWVTITENSMNAKISNTNTSGVKGVCFNKNNNKWIARININGIRVHLGYFETLEGAKQARQIRANEAFGVFTNACEKM